MDDPEVLTQIGSVSVAARSARALVSGEVLAIAGDSFLVRAESIDLANDLLTLLQGFPRVGGHHALGFEFGAVGPACPGRSPDERHGNLALWRDEDRLSLLHDSGYSGVADRDGLEIGGLGEAREPLRRLFLPLVAHTLAFRDIFVVHAGAADAGDGAMLFLGATGSGKSSLAGLSLARSWRVLGDDMVALTLGRDGVTVTGMPRPPAIPAGALPEDLRRRGPLDPRGRVHLDPQILDRSPHNLVGSVLPFRAMKGERRAVPVAGTDRLHELVGSFPAATSRSHLARFLPTARIAAQLPAYRLPIAFEGTHRFIDAGGGLDVVAAQLRAALP